MAPRHGDDDDGKAGLRDGASGSGRLLKRRGYLRLAGTTLASAAVVGAGSGGATAQEARTVTVPSGGSERFDLGSGDTLENVLIDVSAPGADVFITAKGTDWTIRNVGVHGAFDVGSDNNVLDSSYGGGFHQVMNCSGDGLIENVYLGDGCVEGCDRSAMNVGNEHGGHIEMRRCNIGRWSSNAIYAAGFGRRRPPGKTDGAGGTIAFRDCYFHDNNVAHLRISADGTEVENCTLHNTNSVPVLPLSNGGGKNVVNSRGIYTGYGDPGQTITVRNCDFDITSANTNGAASAVVSGDHPNYGDLTTVRIVDSQVRGDLVGDQVVTENVGSNPDTSVPDGVPTSARAAVDGSAAGAAAENSTTAGNSTGGTDASAGVGTVDDDEEDDSPLVPVERTDV